MISCWVPLPVMLAPPPLPGTKADKRPVVSVSTTALNQSGRVLECIGVMMAVYLTLSLLTALAMNAFNRRHALKGVA